MPKQAVESTVLRIGASLLAIQQLEMRMREEWQRLATAYMDHREAMRLFGADGIEDAI